MLCKVEEKDRSKHDRALNARDDNLNNYRNSSEIGMSYRLGVDVGGTFTDLLLINEETGETHTAKVPSTPEDSSVGVLNGVARICDESGINPKDVSRVMHGTTVATNAVLTGKGAKVGLVTTSGYEDTLQVARSFCPGGLGGWVSFVKKPLLAPLELTIGAKERIGADGVVVEPLDEDQFVAQSVELVSLYLELPRVT